MYHNKMSNNKLQVKMKIMNNMKVKKQGHREEDDA